MKKILAICLILMLAATASAATWEEGLGPQKPYLGSPEVDFNETIGYMMLLPMKNETLAPGTVTLSVYMPREDAEVGEGVLTLTSREDGKVAEIGTVESVFSSPKSEAGRRLVYPDGLPFEMLPKSKVVRVAFNGGTAYQPLIATLAMECGVVVNILGADTRNIDGKAFGSMLLGLPENDVEAAKALAYIAAQKDITVEEVPNYHA